MMPNQDLQDTIAIIIALDSLQNNFDITTASLLETGDKSTNEIQSILSSKEVKNISKHTIKGTKKLTMVFKNNNGLKQKVFSCKDCFNYYELGYFRRDYFHYNKR